MPEIILHAEPGVVMNWEDFQATKPPFSIALDGYVSGLTKYSSSGPFANFNHHEDVDRLATRSTCMQVFFSIILGLFDSFRKDGKRFAHVYVNDADQDICLAYWLLKHPDETVSIKWEDPLSKFIVFEDFVDASAGAFPYDDSHEPDSLLKRQAWVFEPYTAARSERVLHAMTGPDLVQLIETIAGRITLFASSQGEKIELDTIPEIIGGGPGWKMIVETSIYARTSIYASGTGAFVGMRPRNDGNYTYVIGKMSPYVPFPLVKIYETLNEIENLDTAENQWGGSDIIGGSPRKTGSGLPPRDVEDIINKIIIEE
ncbi:hypothetical protein N9089_02010 [Crocinitomicaceae bacterium]|nr:hypothetical protein [Crocinitomicaceae bacterium]